MRPHLDYGDIIYHEFDPQLTLEFTKKLKTVPYLAALAVSGAWRGTNKCKLYEELGWEYLYHTFDQPIERTNKYSNTYFQICPKEWNRLDIVQSSETISEFEKRLIQIVRPVKRSIFDVHDLYGVKLLTRLRVEFSDLCSHGYNHNFHCPEPSCSCQTGVENNEHFLLHCLRFSTQRKTLLDLHGV